MPKKNSSKTSTTPKEESDVGLEKPVPTPKKEEKPVPAPKKGDEIDDIFSSKKRKKPEKEKDGGGEEKNKKTKKMKKKMSKRLRESEGEGAGGGDSKPRRRTNDGLAIYSADELGINNQDAGGTPLCPFDCSCCF